MAETIIHTAENVPAEVVHGGEQITGAVLDHAEAIGHHAERIKVLEDGQAAIGTAVGALGGTLDNITNRIESLAQTQIETAQSLAELRAERAAKIEETEVAEQIENKVPEQPAEKPAETVEAPPVTEPENKKRTSPLNWFHRVLGGGE